MGQQTAVTKIRTKNPHPGDKYIYFLIIYEKLNLDSTKQLSFHDLNNLVLIMASQSSFTTCFKIHGKQNKNFCFSVVRAELHIM